MSAQVSAYKKMMQLIAAKFSDKPNLHTNLLLELLCTQNDHIIELLEKQNELLKNRK